MTEKKTNAIRMKNRAWMMTLYSSPEHDWDEESIDAIMKAHGWKWCGQAEEGHEKHHKHFQLYVEAPNPIVGSSLSKAFFHAHVEPRRGTRAEAFAYCVKEDTRVDGPFFHGINAGMIASGGQGKRNDLAIVRDLVNDGATFNDLMNHGDDAVQRVLASKAQYVRDLISAHQYELGSKQRDVRVSYVYGAPGVGKTSSVLSMFPDAYRVKSYRHPFDSYNGQSTLILDEYSGQIDFHELMNMLDRYPYECEARYYNRWALWTRVIIISNLPPTKEALYPDVFDSKWPGFIRRINAGIFNFDEPDDREAFRAGVLPKDFSSSEVSEPLSEVMGRIAKDPNASAMDFIQALDDWLG